MNWVTKPEESQATKDDLGCSNLRSPSQKADELGSTKT